MIFLNFDFLKILIFSNFDLLKILIFKKFCSTWRWGCIQLAQQSCLRRSRWWWWRGKDVSEEGPRLGFLWFFSCLHRSFQSCRRSDLLFQNIRELESCDLSERSHTQWGSRMSLFKRRFQKKILFLKTTIFYIF